LVTKNILFSPEMVRAILDDRKTTARIIIKHIDNNYIYLGSDKQNINVGFARKTTGLPLKIKIPYKPGDTIYVREIWKQYEKRVGTGEQCYVKKFYGYKADEHNHNNPSEFYEGKWKSGVCMPKEAARLFLIVESVNIKRLKDMTEEDYYNEGIVKMTKDGTIYKYCPGEEWWETYHSEHKSQYKGTSWQNMPRTPEEAFKILWNSKIKKADIDEYGWDANPYVWVINFKMTNKEL